MNDLVIDRQCPGDHEPRWSTQRRGDGTRQRCLECHKDAERKRWRKKPPEERRAVRREAYYRKLGLELPPDSILTSLDRWWSNVDDQGADGCWLWTGQTDRRGYGRFRTAASNLAHRFGYEALVGPIPDGLVIDHLCRVTRCVNPHHLEPVTQRENVVRGWAIRSCPGEHEAVWGVRTSGGRTSRYCVICRRENDRRRYLARLKEQQNVS
jgi:hypothetical protein